MCYVLDLLFQEITVGNCVFIFLSGLSVYFCSTPLFWGFVFSTPLQADCNLLVAVVNDSLTFLALFDT